MSEEMVPPIDDTRDLVPFESPVTTSGSLSATHRNAGYFELEYPSPALPSPYLSTPVTTPTSSERPSFESAPHSKPSLHPSSTDSSAVLLVEKDPLQGSNTRPRHELAPNDRSREETISLSSHSAQSPPSTVKRRGTETRIDLDYPALSPAAGISSSVALLNVNCANEAPLDGSSYINFARAANQMAAHRRLANLCVPTTNNAFIHSQGSSRKPAPAPISVPITYPEWSERPNGQSGGTPASAQTFIKSLVHILSPSSTCRSSSTDSRHLSDHTENESQATYSLWAFVASISGALLRFLHFLLSPFNSWLCVTEFLQVTNSLGFKNGSGKLRANRTASIIAILYVTFSVVLFSRDLLIKTGLVQDEGNFQPDLDPRLIPRKLDYISWRASISTKPQSEDDARTGQVDLTDAVVNVDKIWNPQDALKRKLNNLKAEATVTSHSNLQTQPLNSIPHTARFSKLHSKSSSQFTEDILPFLFKATGEFDSFSITACLYTNQFWLNKVSDFAVNWAGPISLVVESFSNDRVDLVRKIQILRDMDPLVRQRVDFHLVSIPPPSHLNRRKNFERLLLQPMATNAQLNLARFFSSSDMIWLVGDAQVVPSAGLYQQLIEHSELRKRVMKRGDAVVIPVFGFFRKDDMSKNPLLRDDGSDFAGMADSFIRETWSSIPVPKSEWPQTREALLKYTTEASSQNPQAAVMAMYDNAWEPTEGPTNYTMWKQFATDEGFADSHTPTDQSSTLLNNAVPEKLESLYPIMSYDLNYAPNLIISRQGQTWCTERFQFNKAACVYQMHLTGTELWVMPQAWSFTVQRMQNKRKKSNDAQRLKELISLRLYSKFHQEACMHYGREFLSLGTWEGDRSSHLRAMCTQVLSSWGVGGSSTR